MGAAAASRPGVSLPKQSGVWADVIGSYRLFNNPKVKPEMIQQQHWQLTRERCGRHKLVLQVQDSSDIDYSRYAAKKGLGPISRENGQGFLQHSVLAVLPGGSLLGLMHQRWQVHQPAPKNESRSERRTRWNEGKLWAEGVDAVGKPPAGTWFITLTDRGGDSFDTMAACDRNGQGFVIRAQHDRCVTGGGRLWEHMAGRPALKTIRVKVPARAASRKSFAGGPAKSQPARTAAVQIRCATVSLQNPKGDPRHKKPREVNVVYAREIDAPAGVTEPIDWMLLTSEPVNSARLAVRIIGFYRRRWVIEEYHKVQKSGCNLERSQLQDVDALRRFAALVGVMSVRMLQLRDLASAALATPAKRGASIEPTHNATDAKTTKTPAPTGQALAALMPILWIAVVAKLAKVKPAELTPPLFWRTIACRGGWLARKHDGRPGWKALWTGWNEVALLVEGAELAQPSS